MRASARELLVPFLHLWYGAAESGRSSNWAIEAPLPYVSPLFRKKSTLRSNVNLPSLYLSYADPDSFFQRGSNYDNVFFLFVRGEGEKESITTICGPSSAHQRNVIKWRFAGGPMMAQHWMLAFQLCDWSGDPVLLRTSIFVIFLLSLCHISFFKRYFLFILTMEVDTWLRSWS